MIPALQEMRRCSLQVLFKVKNIMSRATKAFYSVLAGVLLLSVSAAADTIKLAGIGSNSENGIATVPYFLTVNGGPQLQAMCDDYTHEVVVGETWSGHVYTYADLTANWQLTRGGASVANGGAGLGSLAAVQTAYKELFWLFGQFQLNPTDPNASNINLAAWAIFDPAVKTGSSWNASALAWYNNALNISNYNSVNTSTFRIVTPNDLLDGSGTNPLQNSSPQEYIYNTPEPGSLFLLGSGLLGLGSFIRRKIA